MHDTQGLYKNYWTQDVSVREKRQYYQKLYQHLYSKLKPAEDNRILDVAGGNGQFLHYLDIRKADVIDISESGLSVAKKFGYHTIFANIEERFPIPSQNYDVVFCCEVLEHLHFPNKTLSEINNTLKANGVLFLCQPNMKPDGVHHVRRYKLNELKNDLKKTGFDIEWIDYTPAYSVREAIVHDIFSNPSLFRRGVQLINLTLSFLPFKIRYELARICPDRFALLFVIKARKRGKSS